MKKFAWIFIVLLLTGCGSNLEKLDGKWQGDPAASVALAGPDVQKEFAEIPLVTTMIESIVKNFRVDVDARNKTIAFALGNIAYTGGFTVVSDKGDTIALKTDKGKTLNFVLKDPNTVVLKNDGATDSKLNQMVLKRVQ
ncbi:MAG: hypothetical protein PHI96_07130 [Desulfovibrio sp.]|nr:hypothetical protein [Desulfovibrio sp.]